MSLIVKFDEVPEGTPVAIKNLLGGSILTKRVYGNEVNMMYATRSPGYHSKAHTHDCEQLNWVVEGEMWIFIEREGYHLKKGDFMRVPRNVIHWAMVTGDTECILLECHAPPNVKSAEVQKISMGLYADGEVPDLSRASETIFLDGYEEYVRETELAIFGSEIKG